MKDSWGNLILIGIWNLEGRKSYLQENVRERYDTFYWFLNMQVMNKWERKDRTREQSEN